MTEAPRIGILGPRRVRQGIAPWLAEHVERAGGHVVAIASRKFSSLEKGAEAIEQRLGHGVEGHIGVDSMLANSNLDGVLIASPAATHENALLGALDHGVHVLCEEPSIEPASLAADKLEMIVDSFVMSELHLRTHAQWPLTLPSYFELFPEARGATVERFDMQIAQALPGLTLLSDSLAHTLSLLQELCPATDPVLRSPDIEIVTEDGSVVDVSFGYDDNARVVPCKVRLIWSQDPPRAVSYGVNNLLATGARDPQTGSLAFRADDRSVDVSDPLEQSIREFVELLRRNPKPQPDRRAIERLRMLESLVA